MRNKLLIKKFFLFNEGWKPICYLDTKLIPTVGVGFNLIRRDARPLFKKLGLDYNSVLSKKLALRPDQIVYLLDFDIRNAITEATELFPNFNQIDDVRQIILIDMVANMGRSKVAKFQKMITALKKASLSKKGEDWMSVAAEMKNSQWYHQVKNRGVRNVKAMESGIMPIMNFGPIEKSALIYLH